MATSQLYSVLVGKALTQPEYVHIITRIYLSLLGWTSVKSISRSSRGATPAFWTLGRGRDAD